MAIRSAALVVLAVLALGGCTSSSDDEPPTPSPSARPTTDADCALRIPDGVLTTLGWTPTPKGAEATVRGCHRDAEQGYVEVRDRTGYDKLCATLDRSGAVGPGTPVDWLGDLTACAVEPGADLGTTKVVVQRPDGRAVQITIAALTATGQEQVRAAVQQLLD